MSLPRKISKYYNTLKYLRPVQVYGRVYSLLKHKAGLSNLPQIPEILNTGLQAKTSFLNHDPWNTREDILNGKFTFLNKTFSAGYPVNWSSADGLPLLWQFNLHYFGYLALLNKSEQEAVCTDWIEKNPAGHNTAWHPYVISLRIINWCKAGFNGSTIHKNLYIQAAYLYRHTEFYHPANHYLENARALIFAGIYFNGTGESDKWLRKGLAIFQDELPVQLLPDGGYFERSIMYHAIILEGILDILNILPDQDKHVELFFHAAEKMLAFLTDLTHPDKQIALFNDSTQEIAPTTNCLIEYAQKLGIKVPVITSGCRYFSNTGYAVYRDDNKYIAIDCGKIGPDYIPAHAHADIFSYELSLNGKQFIIDSGVFEYQPGKTRDYTRSTKAHNTVSVDGINQAEVWGGFRVARRYAPTSLSFTSQNNNVVFEGSFAGYSKLIGDNLLHKRCISVQENTISVKDTVTGTGRHFFESYIHLHPDVNIEQKKEIITLMRDNVSACIKTNNAYTITDSFYYPQFGKSLPNKVIIIKSTVPSSAEYSIELN